jgi:transcriptional repressor NrdR
MHCPFCRHTDTRVLDSRVTDDGGAIRRRRSCPADNGGCGKRFSTVEQMQLVVLKRSGATEPFTREKAVAGVRKACKGRPVSEDDLSRLGQRVNEPTPMVVQPVEAGRPQPQPG